MALGLPVVVSNVPLWKGIVDSPQVGATVDFVDAAAAAKAIADILADESLYAAFPDSATRAAENHSWQAESRILQGFLQGILAKNSFFIFVVGGFQARVGCRQKNSTRVVIPQYAR